MNNVLTGTALAMSALSPTHNAPASSITTLATSASEANEAVEGMLNAISELGNNDYCFMFVLLLYCCCCIGVVLVLNWC